MKSRISCIVCTTALCAEFALADPEIEQMLVTGTRTRQPLVESLSAGTVLDRATIERTQASSLFELLERVPGVNFVRNGGPGSATALLLRGNQSDHTLFLIDGVRVGSATLGSTALQYINPDLIERVEVVRGAKSSLYGSDAIGGVVNIITRKADKPAEIDVKAGFGNHGTQEHSLVSGFNSAAHNLNLVLGYQYTDGTDNTENALNPSNDDDAYRNTSVALSYRLQALENFGAGVSYQHNEAEVEYDTDCTRIDDFSSVACSPYTSDMVSALTGDVFIRPVDAWTSTLRLGYSIDDTQNRADDIDLGSTNSGGDFKTRKQEATWQNDISFATSQLLTLGVEYVEDEVDATTEYDETSRDNTALFAQLQLDFHPVDLLLGVRNDDNEQFGSETTYNAGLGFALSETLRLNASYGEGFKAPTFNDLYFPDFGNPDFLPEESQDYELELRGNFAKGSFSIALFKNDLDNLIQFNALSGITDQTAEAQIKGAEAAFSVNLSGWLVGLVATLLDTENAVTGGNLARRPEQTLHLDIDKEFGALALGLSAHAEDSRFDDASNSVELGGFATLDLRARYAINDNWQLKLKLDNIFDRRYATATDFSLGRFVQPGFATLFSVVYSPKL